MRNRINLSRGNYKEPYIRQPATRSRLSPTRELLDTRWRGNETYPMGRGDQPRFEEGGGGEPLLRFEARVRFDSRGVR